MTFTPPIDRGRIRNAHQLAQELREAVVNGQLAEGDRLPTITELSRQVGVSRSAVHHAFTVLRGEGLIASRKRGGTYVTRRERRRAEPMRIFTLISLEQTTGFYRSLHRGFDTAAARIGYHVSTVNTDNDLYEQAESIVRLIEERVAGVAIVPVTIGPSTPHHARLLQRHGIPVVLLHRAMEGVRAPVVTIPAEHVARVAGRQLLAHGHRRIAYCTSQPQGNATRYERGLRDALLRSGVRLDPRHVHYGNVRHFDNRDYHAFEQQFDAWFARTMHEPDRPTALFTSFETIGEIAYLVALKHGLRVPENLSIVTIAGRDRRGAIAHRLACVTVDEDRAGEQAVTLLDDMCRGRREMNDTTILTIGVGFDAGDSLAAPRA